MNNLGNVVAYVVIPASLVAAGIFAAFFLLHGATPVQTGWKDERTEAHFDAAIASIERLYFIGIAVPKDCPVDMPEAFGQRVGPRCFFGSDVLVEIRSFGPLRVHATLRGRVHHTCVAAYIGPKTLSNGVSDKYRYSSKCRVPYAKQTAFVLSIERLRGRLETDRYGKPK